MADTQQNVEVAPQQERRGRGFGRGRGGRGRGGARKDEEEWIPCTKLGRLVKAGKIEQLEDIYVFSMPIKEHQIIDKFIAKDALKEENMAMFPVQKASSAGQRTRFKSYSVVGDSNGHIGVGSRSSKEASGSMKAALIAAKLNIIPVRRGFWGNNIGAPHTIPMKVTGKAGSVTVRLVPAPRGAGIVASPVPTKILQMAGVQDVFTCSTGKTRTRGNFIMATFYALRKTYGFLTPDLWADNGTKRDPTDEFSRDCAKIQN